MAGPRPPLAVAVALLCLALVAPPVTAHPVDSGTQTDTEECERRSDAPTADVNRTELLVAPTGAFDTLTSATAIRRAVEAGRLTAPNRSEPLEAGESRHDSVALGDTVVHRVDPDLSAVLLERLGAANGSTPTARFASLVSAEGVEFKYEGPYSNPPEVNLSASIAAGTLRVVPDEEAGELYVVVESGGLLFGRERSDPSTVPVQGRREFHLSVTPESGFVDEPIRREVEYEVVSRDARVFVGDDGLLDRAAAANQPVCGATTVAPGSEITVGLRPVGGGPLETVGTARVDESYTFTAGLNLSGTAPGAYGLGGRNLSVRGAPLLVVGNGSGAAVELTDTREFARVERLRYELTTTDGGIVVVRNETGAVVGTSIRWTAGRVSSGLLLDRPVTRNGTLTATVYRDVNGNETYDAADEPYRVDGEPVTATADVTVIDPDTAVDQPVTSTTPRVTDTVAPGTTLSVTTGPGFGGFVALLGGGLAVLIGVLRG